MFRIAVPPGKSDARDSALASSHGQRIAPRKHVHSRKRRGNGMARGARGGGSELNRYCALSKRGVPSEDAVPGGVCCGVSCGGAARSRRFSRNAVARATKDGFVRGGGSRTGSWLRKNRRAARFR